MIFWCLPHTAKDCVHLVEGASLELLLQGKTTNLRRQRRVNGSFPTNFRHFSAPDLVPKYRRIYFDQMHSMLSCPRSFRHSRKRNTTKKKIRWLNLKEWIDSFKWFFSLIYLNLAFEVLLQWHNLQSMLALFDVFFTLKMIRKSKGL